MYNGQVQISDELLLREVQYRGALQLARLLQDKVNNPDFFSVEKTVWQGDGEFDTETELYNYHELATEIRNAREDGCLHLCVQAHYLLPGGKGEASITLVLDD